MNKTIKKLLILVLVSLLLSGCALNPRNIVSTSTDSSEPKQTENTTVFSTETTELPSVEDNVETPVENKISETVPLQINQGNYGLVKAGAVDEMVADIAQRNFGIQDIKTVYQSAEIKQRLGIYGYGDIIEEMSSPSRSLYIINEEYPIEYINRINEDTVYAVYKTNDRDNETSYLYLFFKQLDDQRELVDDRTETWWLQGKAFIVKKGLQYNDFSTIEVGSSISDVRAVDPIVNANFGTDGDFTDPFNSYHLLKDGVLKIQYTFDEADSIYRVAVMEYVESFEIPIIENGNASTVCVRINANDYPH